MGKTRLCGAPDLPEQPTEASRFGIDKRLPVTALSVPQKHTSALITSARYLQAAFKILKILKTLKVPSFCS
jgi:hypothetical protein